MIFFLDFKTNFCGLIHKDQNYDYAGYSEYSNDKSCTERAGEIMSEILVNRENKIDDLETIMSPRVNTQSRSRLPIYYQTKCENKLESLQESHEIYGDYQVPWHSTKIDIDITYAKHLQNSTRNTELLQTAINPQSSINSSSDDNTSKSSIESTTICDEKHLFKIDMETIYACCLDYNALYEGDLTVRVADRVIILFDAGSEFVLVKHIRTQKCGYVPRICILNVNKFLAELN